MSDYQPQTPSMSLLEICDVLWLKGEYQAYWALRIYTKERDEMIKELKELRGTAMTRDEIRYISMLPPPRPWIPKTRAGRLALFLWRWCA